jgi:hypothetical protein
MMVTATAAMPAGMAPYTISIRLTAAAVWVLKFSTYFLYNAKLCLNGHEYAKRQLQHKEIAFEALDKGVLQCADPRRL